MPEKTDPTPNPTPESVPNPAPAAPASPEPTPAASPAASAAPAPAGKPTPAAEPSKDDIDEPITLEDGTRLAKILEGLPTKAGKPTARLIETLAASDPEVAHALKAMLTDYNKGKSKTSEERKAIEAEKKELAEARRRMDEENDRFRRAMLESGLGAPLPTGEPPAPVPEPDWSTLGTEPKEIAKAVRDQLKAELLAELRGHIREEMKPAIEPLTKFRGEVSKQQAEMSIRRLISDTPDWEALKPDVDAFITAENEAIKAGTQQYKRQLSDIIDIVRGRRAASTAARERDRQAEEDKARLDGALGAGRGGATKAVPTIPPDVVKRGARAFMEAYDSYIKAGYSPDEIRAANPGLVPA